jgi:hypothetical protein
MRIPLRDSHQADCVETATLALCFGDGTTRQMSVAYSAEHAEIVKLLFVTCDERAVRS